MEIYQDIYTQGEVRRKGVRECKSRYTALQEFAFSKFKRQFSVLDIGANFGYFAIRAAEDFKATAIMVQPQPEAGIILKTCQENPHLNLNLLDIKISPSRLEELATCESFDVVLALNVLHHMGPDWKRAAEAMFKMGEYVIIETPRPGDKGACGKEHLKSILDFCEGKDRQTIGEFSRHTDPNSKSPMMLFKGNKPTIEKPFMGGPKRKTIEISSTLEDKKIIKGKNEYDWVHGMNLYNFRMLNGTYPPKETIETKIKERDVVTSYAWDNSHHDITPWNYIINGPNLHLIDIEGNHYNSGHQNDTRGTEFTIKKLNMTESVVDKDVFDNE